MNKTALLGRFLKARGEKKLEEQIWNLRKQKFQAEGTGSSIHDVLVKPIVSVLSRVGAIHPSRRTQMENAIWDHYGSPLIKADVAAGQQLGKIPLVGKLFRHTEEFKGMDIKPGLLRGLGGQEVLKHETFRATAPIAKAQPIVMPLAGAMYISSKLGPSKQPGVKTGGRMINPDLLRKTASAIRSLESDNKSLKSQVESLTKEAQATKLAVQMIQDGELDPTDLSIKIEELLRGDLQITKEAMAFTKAAKASDLGHLSERSVETHTADPLTDYLMGMVG